ncbi:hypothetical protein ABCW44_09355 [Mannheimia haemolytica]|uniref:hypothetical protein n=1 Tax=Mannheimia haemolytica TaxID=75985 RepID=UPI002EB73A35|nr:hypothetical protein [Mannheimia haemolytica]
METQSEKPTEIATIRLKGEVANFVKAIAEAEERSFAYVAQKLIKEAAEARGWKMD